MGSSMIFHSQIDTFFSLILTSAGNSVVIQESLIGSNFQLFISGLSIAVYLFSMILNNFPTHTGKFIVTVGYRWQPFRE